MSAAYEEGVAAFWDDGTYANPYKEDTREYIDWEEGYDSAWAEWYANNQYVGVDFDD